MALALILRTAYGDSPIGPRCDTLAQAIAAAARFPLASSSSIVAVDSRTGQVHELRVGPRTIGGVNDV